MPVFGQPADGMPVMGTATGEGWTTSGFGSPVLPGS